MSNLAYDTDQGRAAGVAADMQAMQDAAAGAAHLDPGLLRDGGRRRSDRARRRGPAHGEGASEGPHGRHRDGGRVLPDGADAQSDHPGIAHASRASCSSRWRQLAEFCDPSTKVVVIGHYNDVWLYRELIRSGISEYVVAPISMADIVGVIASIFVDPDAEPLGRSIAFIGAKGGVGSSTIAHNVAWAMSTLFESEVVVADLDLAFGTANINFDQDPAQGIAEAVFAPERIDEVYLDRLLAQCAEHLSLLAAPVDARPRL